MREQKQNDYLDLAEILLIIFVVWIGASLTCLGLIALLAYFIPPENGFW